MVGEAVMLSKKFSGVHHDSTGSRASSDKLARPRPRNYHPGCLIGTIKRVVVPP